MTDTHTLPRPWVTGWGADAWSWNVSDEDGDEGDGMPGRGLVGGALSFWVHATPGVCPMNAVSLFNLPLHLVEDAWPAESSAPCDLGEAIQVWSLLVGGDRCVDEASVVLGRAPSEILAALDDHPWMYAERRGDRLCIGHEGE